MELPHFLLFTILLLLAFSYPELATSKPHNNFSDVESLLAFKSQADIYGTLTASWTTNTSFCNWIGVYCSHRRQRVTAIRLYNVSLHGTISPYLANLSFLSDLTLSNNSLTGHIPEALAQLPRLTILALQLNFLSGPIPRAIFNMSSLNVLAFAYNNLSGSIPSNKSVTMLPRLRAISLSSNYLSGEVLSNISQSRNLQVLDLSQNLFSGTIPDEIGSLLDLTLLDLGVNQLTGTIPHSLGNLTKLQTLDLESNKLTGAIPEGLGNLENLQYLNLRIGYLTGSIPTSLQNLSFLYHFDLCKNKLTGSVPAGIGKFQPLLKWFHVGSNQLTGRLEFLSSLTNCRNLQYLHIYNNTLEGVLPDSIGNFSTNLNYFVAWRNLITGKIPSTLGNLSALVVLDLGSNELIQTIPSSLSRLESLQYMGLDVNSLSGSVPLELGLMKSLDKLFIHNNALSGPIPVSLANISMIQLLSLYNNKFSSIIPSNVWTLRNLLHLDMHGNNLNGSIPPQVGDLKALTHLDLSTNQLSGNISSQLGNLPMLTYLDLSNNSFQGEIPELFGGLISVTYLNLSYNFLSGAIPKSLANLPTLDSIDLSFNKLEGQVPKGRVFSNSTISSVMGNEALCGAPLLHLSPCHANLGDGNSGKNLRSLKYILPATMFGVVLLTCIYLIYTFYSRRKIKTPTDTQMTHLDDHRVVSYHELVRATTNFSDENLLGKGAYGSVFKGCLDDGLIVAIKVLNLEVEGSSKSFDAECQVLRTVRHRNLIKIISVCSNLDFKALVLKFMPNGSLDQWLYSENYILNLIQRLNIVVDVSLALEYLHHHHTHVVLHCDLKPTNILLDDELVAHVSDFGISKLLLGDNISMATASMPGTIGYIAPEYTSTGAVSRMGDVYSFGILMLEIITRKKPVDNAFGEQSSLRELICKAHPTAILDVVDENILKDHAMNSGLSQDLSTLHRCLSSLIELGLVCSSYSPKERIPMTDVVARLQKIKTEYLSSLASS